MIKDERQFLHVAVIGAGLGGLSAAISLAAEGFKVSVFEKNDKAGGKLNVLRRQGFSFDLGPSILTMPQIFQTLFEQAGRRMEDYAAIEEIKPHWRNFFEDGTVIDLTPDVRDMERELQKLPPDESDGFFEFLEYSRKLTKITEEGYFAKGLDTFWELINFYGPLRSLLRFDVWRNLDQGVRRFVKNPKLIDILNYFIKYVGSSPYDAPALLNLLPYIQFGYGLWYVKGGMYNLALGLERLLGELGGELHYGVRVSRIETEGSRATGLVLSDGRRVQADLIVSNMEVIPAYTDLLKEGSSFLKRYEKFEPSCSGLVLHLGVNQTYPQLAHHNFFYSQDARKHFDSVFHKRELSHDPTIYLVAPVKTDPSLAPPGCEIIKVLPHIPHIRDVRPFTRRTTWPFGSGCWTNWSAWDSSIFGNTSWWRICGHRRTSSIAMSPTKARSMASSPTAKRTWGSKPRRGVKNISTCTLWGAVSIRVAGCRWWFSPGRWSETKFFRI